MRRAAVAALACAAVFAGACGGGDDSGASASAKASAGDGESAAAIAAAAQRACDGREAVNFASTYGQALSESNSEDLRTVAAALEDAADAAPAEIRADFRLVVEAIGPFLELFAEAGGDFRTLAEDPEFKRRAERVGSEEVQQASGRVNTWFEEHCN